MLQIFVYIFLAASNNKGMFYQSILFLLFFTLLSCNTQNIDVFQNNDANSDLSWVGTNTHIINGSVYKRFLKDNGVCDVAAINLGWARCSKWDSAPDIKLSLDKSALPSGGKLGFVIYADSLGRFGQQQYKNLTLNVDDSNPFKWWNNQQGFATWTQGSKHTKAWSADVKIKVYGDPSDDSVEIEVDYRNERMLEATVEKRGVHRKVQSLSLPFWHSIKNFFQNLF